jgi:hypothetical protein
MLMVLRQHIRTCCRLTMDVSANIDMKLSAQPDTWSTRVYNAVARTFDKLYDSAPRRRHLLSRARIPSTRCSRPHVHGTGMCWKRPTKRPGSTNQICAKHIYRARGELGSATRTQFRAQPSSPQ